jgi:hypothetical protein
VHIDLAHLWPELEDATDDPGLPKTLAEMTAAQVERAMNNLFETDVANRTNEEEDMVGSTFVLMVTQDDIIDLQEEGVAELNGPLADPNLTKVFTVEVDAYDEDDDEFSYAVTEQGLIEFAEMFSNLSDLNAANFSFTAAGQANIAQALINAGLEPEEDPDPPKLLGTDPGNNEVDVPVDTDIVLTFDEDVEAGTGLIGIFQAGGVLHEAINVNDADFDGNIVTFELETELTGGTNYYVNIAEGAIEDLAGNAYEGIEIGDTTTFNFTTKAAPGPEENVVEMENGGIYTATDGVVDVFRYDVDSSTGRVVGLDGEGEITGFNVDEDRFEFVDAGDQLTTENFTTFLGVSLGENPIQDTTTIGFDPSEAGSSLITITGVQDAALNSIDFLVV